MINNVALMGRLTADPETRTFESGAKKCEFTLAVDRRYNPDGEKNADFIRCEAWNKTADFICKYFSKGSMLALTGEIRTDSYKDSNDQTRTKVYVSIANASFCGSRNDNDGEGTIAKALREQEAKKKASVNIEYGDVEEIPDPDDADLPF